MRYVYTSTAVVHVIDNLTTVICGSSIFTCEIAQEVDFIKYGCKHCKTKLAKRSNLHNINLN